MTAANSLTGGALRRWWRRPRARALVWQALVVMIFGAAVWWLAGNIAVNLPRLKMELNFGFLFDRASFELGDNLLGYRAGDRYLLAFAAGIVNTLQVAIIGIVLTAIVGTVVALVRLSGNALAGSLAWLYVEISRNLPLLLQLFLWQALLVRALPAPLAAWQPLPDVFVSNRGLSFPTLAWQPALTVALFAWVFGIVVFIAARRNGRRSVWLHMAWLLPPLCAWWLLGRPFALDPPVLQGFNVRGGATLVPEFFSLLFGLVFCHAAYAAESIRAGILGVARGQWDAARSLGLSRWQILRLVVLPQSLRLLVPPMTSNFLSLTKSSSLAVAIGYPELVRVSTVAISETGRAIECITIIVAVYLSLSLLTSALMNRYNQRIALRGGVAA
jgi:general L-amino acid transport system permease protein